MHYSNGSMKITIIFKALQNVEISTINVYYVSTISHNVLIPLVFI